MAITTSTKTCKMIVANSELYLVGQNWELCKKNIATFF